MTVAVCRKCAHRMSIAAGIPASCDQCECPFFYFLTTLLDPAEYDRRFLKSIHIAAS